MEIEKIRVDGCYLTALHCIACWAYEGKRGECIALVQYEKIGKKASGCSPAEGQSIYA